MDFKSNSIYQTVVRGLQMVHGASPGGARQFARSFEKNK
jgi:hypothetical protein